MQPCRFVLQHVFNSLYAIQLYRILGIISARRTAFARPSNRFGRTAALVKVRSCPKILLNRHSLPIEPAMECDGETPSADLLHCTVQRMIDTSRCLGQHLDIAALAVSKQLSVLRTCIGSLTQTCEQALHAWLSCCTEAHVQQRCLHTLCKWRGPGTPTMKSRGEQ